MAGMPNVSPVIRTANVSRFPDPFAPKPHDWWKNATNALLATALFRCWHILMFYAAWATVVSVINHHHHAFTIQPTLLTVIGTVLGFVISYRTTSSFERYNEGRRYWSQILLGSRTFARIVWFNVPDVYPTGPTDKEENKARVLIEKKTAINLLEAFAVAVKHYLRGEDGIYYRDLYHLVKFLPAYALPNSLPSVEETSGDTLQRTSNANSNSANGAYTSSPPHSPALARFASPIAGITKRVPPALPLPVTAPQEKTHFVPARRGTIPPSPRAAGMPRRPASTSDQTIGKDDDDDDDDDFLLPARMPPKYHLFDLFPFSLFIHCMSRDSKHVKGKKAARKRARMANSSENLPLEISLYLGSYIGALQERKVLDAPTSNAILAALNQLVDALTGLERILTTPIPFSYSVHLWVVTTIYCLALPLQIWATLKWLTIPATVILAFIFFGFLVAGEEIENPFGYDKNDLNMDHFTNNIIRNELRAVTAVPAPNIAIWAFTPLNDLIFASQRENKDHVTPAEWVKQGSSKMVEALAA
ncbi:UPF0187-domain-containing protein [Athelia psychrophila]|uniref:UPF0187-domain-containing protein n=1 Tax=Athelia psychrophila TaxID=1759441 RepID=A0A165WWA8_9AGAM|nr:UPF0187-domain-containing protein [Fibularhizoctonia sp. CBS 109695]